MDGHKRINHLLEGLSEELGYTFALDEKGVCPIQFKNNFIGIIEVPKESPVVYLYGAVHLLMEDDPYREAILEECMLLNAFQDKTRGGVLFFSPELSQIIFSYRHDIHALKKADFKNLIGNFFETAIELRTNLEEKFSPEPIEAHKKS